MVYLLLHDFLAARLERNVGDGVASGRILGGHRLFESFAGLGVFHVVLAGCFYGRVRNSGTLRGIAARNRLFPQAVIEVGSGLAAARVGLGNRRGGRFRGGRGVFYQDFAFFLQNRIDDFRAYRRVGVLSRTDFGKDELVETLELVRGDGERFARFLARGIHQGLYAGFARLPCLDVLDFRAVGKRRGVLRQELRNGFFTIFFEFGVDDGFALRVIVLERRLVEGDGIETVLTVFFRQRLAAVPVALVDDRDEVHVRGGRNAAVGKFARDRDRSGRIDGHHVAAGIDEAVFPNFRNLRRGNGFRRRFLKSARSRGKRYRDDQDGEDGFLHIRGKMCGY